MMLTCFLMLKIYGILMMIKTDDTVNAAYFSATRLISLQTRNSAAYKGIMALVYRERCHDFVQGTTIDIVKSMDEAPDIHHIFPEAYCIKKGYKREKWNSIVNKTPLLPESNRQIGGEAPSAYSKRVMRKAEIDEAELRARVESHLVDYDLFITDDFDGYFIARAKAIMKAIEAAMGKLIADKGSEQTINIYGVTLEDQPMSRCTGMTSSLHVSRIRRTLESGKVTAKPILSTSASRKTAETTDFLKMSCRRTRRPSMTKLHCTGSTGQSCFIHSQATEIVVPFWSICKSSSRRQVLSCGPAPTRRSWKSSSFQRKTGTYGSWLH